MCSYTSTLRGCESPGSVGTCMIFSSYSQRGLFVVMWATVREVGRPRCASNLSVTAWDRLWALPLFSKSRSLTTISPRLPHLGKKVLLQMNTGRRHLGNGSSLLSLFISRETRLVTCSPFCSFFYLIYARFRSIHPNMPSPCPSFLPPFLW